MPYKSKADKAAHDKARRAQHYATWPGRVSELVRSAKRRAAKKTGEQSKFELSTEHVALSLEQQKYRCAATGIPFSLDSGLARKNPWAPSLDKINPYGGYTKKNTQIVCVMYNEAKGQHTDEELKMLARCILNPMIDPGE